jgi:hypothetical protein
MSDKYSQISVINMPISQERRRTGLSDVRVLARARRVPDEMVGRGLSRSLPDSTTGIATWLDAREPRRGGDLIRIRSMPTGQDSYLLVSRPGASGRMWRLAVANRLVRCRALPRTSRPAPRRPAPAECCPGARHTRTRHLSDSCLPASMTFTDRGAKRWIKEKVAVV